VCQAALTYEFKQAEILFEKEKALSVPYENIILDIGFRCDFLVASKVIVACNAVQELTPFDQARLLNYLKIKKRQDVKTSKLQVGLFINFNVLVLKDDIRSGVNKLNE